MRVVGGKYKRSTLNTLDSLLTRPTKDMVKEALFSSISINEETIFLDLFSGSGSIGIEALSRGAKDVVFNDSNKDAVKIINENLKKFNEKRKVFNYDYKTCLNKLNGYCFDYIYLDPPYNFEEYDQLMNQIIDNNLTCNEGIIIVEVNKKVDLLPSYSDFNLYKERKYGIAKLLYYKR